MRPLELLAPAKNLETGIAAIEHGADAIYIGAEQLGARSAAGNSVEDIAQLCQYAKQFGVKVYVTLNVIVYEHEIDYCQKLITQLYNAGVDALIVQDMGVLKMDIPPIELHASTQTDNRTADKVSWLKSLGFARVVLARELSLDAIKAIHKQEPDVELEVFVHGALCVSYSGVCYVSQHSFGRSANRGECAQFCRMSFDLVDSDDREIEHQRHLLSLKHSFDPNLNKTFNRGFTTYFLHQRDNKIASFDTPKAIGEPVGKVKDVRNNYFVVAGVASFANGDGLCFMNNDNKLEGFRVNRVEGNKLFPFKMPRDLKSGVYLFRNNDEAFEKVLSKPTAVRKIALSMQFATTSGGFALTLQAEGYDTARVERDFQHEAARQNQYDNIVKQLSKLGNTIFEAGKIDIEHEAQSLFVPSSLLADMRREALEQFKPHDNRRLRQKAKVSGCSVNLQWQKEYKEFPYTYNIANSLATAFYTEQGLKDPEEAFEVKGDKNVPQSLLMQCKHCIRYSLGHCVVHGGVAPKWKEPLYLKLSDGRKFRLQFDCSQCQMNIYANS